MNTLFSIIVPIYNVESYLHECIDSLIGQTYSNIEIILVDDGSKDSCPSICDYYARKDNRVKVIHKKNGGANSARKAGAAVAQGDYILCVDGDDYVLPKYVEKFANCINETGAEVVCTRDLVDRIEKQRYYNRSDIQTFIFPKLIHTSEAKFLAISLWGNAFKRELYCKYQEKVDDRIKIGEDIACLNPILCHANSICLIPECLYCYRISIESMTHGGKSESWDDPKMVTEHLKKWTANVGYDFSDAINRGATHHLFNVAVSQFNRNESFGVIRKDIRKQLQKVTFTEIIKNTHFSLTYRTCFIMWALKDRTCILLYLYARYKN